MRGLFFVTHPNKRRRSEKREDKINQKAKLKIKEKNRDQCPYPDQSIICCGG